MEMLEKSFEKIEFLFDSIGIPLAFSRLLEPYVFEEFKI